ncbi:MAG: hypothetical protein RIB80_17870 [Rhodospirillales bacterium]
MELKYEILEVDDIDLGPAQTVLDYWNSVRGGAFAPAWMRQFRLSDLPPRIVPDMTVIDRIDAGQNFYYRFWGTNHVLMKGFEMTGKTIDQTPNKTIQHIGTRQLEITFQRRRPTVFLYSIDYPSRHRPTEFILRLPLSDDGAAISGFASFQDLNAADARWETLMENVWPEQFSADDAR